MSGDRDPHGRFRRGGRSANPAGRPVGRSQAIGTRGDIARLILKVAGRKVPQRAPDDGLPKVTLLERNLRSLMTGNPANRLACEATVELVQWAAEQNELEQMRLQVAEEQRLEREARYGR
jgi:hypothetical protein